MSWEVMINGFGERCFVPTEDTEPHDLEGACFCCPVYINDTIVHNAADGRKEFEEDRKRND